MTPPEKNDQTSPDLPRGTVRVTVHCLNCGYNLKGIDAAGRCPECGAPVQPTLQAVISADGGPLALLKSARVVAVSLVCLLSAVLCNAVLLWVPYLAAVVSQIRSPAAPPRPDLSLWHMAAVGLLAAIALTATVGLASPTGAEAQREYRRGLNWVRAGVIFWAILHLGLLLHDAMLPVPRREWWDLFRMSMTRSALRIGLDVALLTVVLGLRPVVAFLALRSPPHRRGGGASRQGLVALGVAILIVLTGDAAALFASTLRNLGWLRGGLADNVGVVLAMTLMVGSIMLTIALLNLTVDALRLAGNLVKRTYPLEEVIG